MTIHQSAEVGFGSADNPYEEGRPAYPSQVLGIIESRLGSLAGRRVLELGSGTGKFTTMLKQGSAVVTALEPVKQMQEVFKTKHPDVEVLAGSAAGIPLAAGSVDAVFAAQAFHWFGNCDSLREMHRVLKAGGGLCLLWNVRDASVDWIQRLNAVIDRYTGTTPRYKTGEWKKAFAEFPGFAPLSYDCCKFAYEVSPETIVKRVASISFIAALPDEARCEVLEEVRALLSLHPETRGRAWFPFPHYTDIYCTHAVR